MKKLLKTGAALLTALLLGGTAILPVLAADTAELTHVHVFGTDLYCTAEHDVWYGADGTEFTAQTEAVQTLQFRNETYTVNIADLRAYDEYGDVCEEITAVLPECFSFRPMSLGTYTGLREAEAREILQSIPLTYAFAADQPECRILLNGQEVGSVEFKYTAGQAQPVWLLPKSEAFAAADIDAPGAEQNETLAKLLAACSPMAEIGEQAVKPAEIIGGQAYVAVKQMRQTAALLVRCADRDGLAAAAGSRTVLPLADFLSEFEQAEVLEGRTRSTVLPLNLQNNLRDDVYAVSFCWGTFPQAAEIQRLTEAIAEFPQAEIIGLLQTDWAFKGYYDDWDLMLDIRPAEGKTVRWDELNTPEYHSIRSGGAVGDDGLSYEEAAALCEKLEARDDIAYAWIYPRYLADIKANQGSFCWSLDLTEPVRGDVDGDGTVTMKDAMAALRLSDNAELFDDGLETYDAAADMDSDGKVTMKDAMYILRYADELMLGYEPDWNEILG